MTAKKVSPLKPIPEEWILSYVDELLEMSKNYDEGSEMQQRVLQRAQYTLDLIEVWRTRQI